MEAIFKLYRSGLNRASVAAAIEADSQLIGMYERCQRFPGVKNFSRIVKLADSRGITLLAHDFLDKGNN